MYRHHQASPWYSLRAAVVAAILVIVLFGILPFANHVSFKRLFLSGGLSAVPALPPPSLDVAKNAVDTAVFQTEGNLPALPRADEASQKKSLEIKPVIMPILEPQAISTKQLMAFVFDVSDLDTQPVPVHRVAPQYPELLRAEGVDGRVMVEFRVDKNGRVISAKILEETHPDFGVSVVDAVMRWKFLPGTVRGDRVSFRVRLPVSFRIDGIPSEERNAFKLVSNDAGDRR